MRGCGSFEQFGNALRFFAPTGFRIGMREAGKCRGIVTPTRARVLKLRNCFFRQAKLFLRKPENMLRKRQRCIER
jgi:hypothetical protein